MTESWSSVLEVAERRQVAGERNRHWIRRKGLPAQRLGRIWRFKLSEVDGWLRAGSSQLPDVAGVEQPGPT